jgi:hypothetical protein
VYISDEMSKSSTELFQLIEFFSKIHGKILENEQMILPNKPNEIVIRQECAASFEVFVGKSRFSSIHIRLPSHQLQIGFNSMIDDS